MSTIYQISEEYFNELLDYTGRSLSGKILKRFEILNDKDAIKKSVKELIYEETRQLRDLVIAHNKGLNMSSFIFKRGEGAH